jgi:putative intracellular protease/amidase
VVSIRGKFLISQLLYTYTHKHIITQAAHPYYVLAPYFIIDWASPDGGKAPLDPSSVTEAKNDKQCARFLKDEVAKQSGYENTLKLADVKSKDYEAIVFVGGHGPMFDSICHNVSIKLVESFWNEGKIVSAICHGPAALRKSSSFISLIEDLLRFKLTRRMPMESQS